MQFHLLIPYVLLLSTTLVATSAEKNAGILRLYEMSDLLFPDKCPKDSSLEILDSNMEWQTKDLNNPLRDAFHKHLVPHFQPAVWEQIRTSSEWRGCTLGLTASPEFHSHVEQVLKQIRNSRVLEVQLKCSLVLMPPRERAQHYTKSGFVWKPVAERPDVAFTEVSRAEAEKFLSVATGNPHISKSQTNLDISVIPGQQATTPDSQQIEYLPFSPLPGLDKPRPKILALGHRLTASATPTEDRSLLAISMDHQCTRLIDMRPIDTGNASAEEPLVWTGGERIECLMAASHSLIIATGIYLDAHNPPQCGFLVVSPAIVTHRSFSPPDPFVPSSQAPIYDFLKKPVTVNFVNTTLFDAIVDLRDQTSAPIEVDPRLKAHTISFQCNQLCLDAALDWIMNLSPPGICLCTSYDSISLKPLAVTDYLDHSISMKWENTDLSETLSKLRTQTSVAIVVDPKILGENRHRVTLDADNMEIESVLRSICKQLAIHYQVRDDAIHLLEGEAPTDSVAK